MVVAKTNGIDKRAGERMRFLHRQDLPRCKRSKSHIAKGIGGTIRSAVIQICAEEAVFVGKLLVDARGYEVFVNHLLAVEVIRAHIYACAAILRNRVERQILLNEWINCDGDGISV